MATVKGNYGNAVSTYLKWMSELTPEEINARSEISYCDERCEHCTCCCDCEDEDE